ncbi:MAG: hypothetical protein KAI47_07790 [Deltaproteobacteria bacterium]|nr:hypothetical protein [Deltaproteobacteria bacterium]
MRRLLLVFSGLLMACPGPGPGRGGSNPITGVTPTGKPRWVDKGSGAFNGELGRAFYGVGLVAGIRNPALSRQTADNRARGEIAKIFHTYIAAMMKDYQRSTTAGNFKASAEEQDVVSAQKTITEVTLRGVEIRDHWTDPASGTQYALAVLELKRILKDVGNTNQLPARIRDHVRRNAAKAFNDLDKELQKRTQREDPAPAAAAPAAPATPDTPAVQPPVETTPPPPVVHKKKGKLRVGLKIKGRDARKIQTCFASEIINAGFELIETSNDVDVMVVGTLNFKKARYNNGQHMVRASLDVRVMDMETGKTAAAVATSFKTGRPTLTEALQTAVTKICKKFTPRVVAKIKSTFVR